MKDESKPRAKRTIPGVKSIAARRFPSGCDTILWAKVGTIALKLCKLSLIALTLFGVSYVTYLQFGVTSKKRIYNPTSNELIPRAIPIELPNLEDSDEILRGVLPPP